MIMKKVHLTMLEENKYLVIKRLVERGGNKLNAAVKLNCTERTINRLIRKYKLEGKSAFIHKNKIGNPVPHWMKPQRSRLWIYISTRTLTSI